MVGEPLLYPLESVRRVIAFIPPGHYHVRLLLETCRQTMIFHEATIAGIVRAYAIVALHPSRRAIELIGLKLPASRRKHGFAEYQLVESNRPEDEVMAEAVNLWNRARMACREEGE